LASALTDRWGEPVEVTDTGPLVGGASREIWALTARTRGGGRRLVLRMNPPGAAQPADLALEEAVLTAAAGAGVPVAHPRGLGDGSDAVGQPYLLMDHVDGETIPRRLLRDPRFADARAGLAAELGRVLARLHSVPPDSVPMLTGGDALDGLRAEHDAYGEPRPALEVVFRWLAEHRPAPAPFRVLHGDFRNGNLMVGPDGLRAVLDWELAHLGDPVQDLGWLCAPPWRFGAPAPVGGFGERAELLDGYAEVAGWRPTEEALHWWEVFGTVRWAVICRRQAQRHLDGSEPSVELAVIGRRICESEFDALCALGLADPVTVADPLAGLPPAGVPTGPVPASEPGAGSGRGPGAAGCSVHDRPSVDELLAAASGFLTAARVAGADGGGAPGAGPRFHARVAANALAIARRELLLGAGQARAHARRLADLGCADDRALVEAVRTGSLDGRWDDVLAAVRELTVAKLTVANPRHLARAVI
jgi:aminoglycoside phosphotransferase (APT) family kinase protein